jgi:hypothetical protein
MGADTGEAAGVNADNEAKGLGATMDGAAAGVPRKEKALGVGALVEGSELKLKVAYFRLELMEEHQYSRSTDNLLGQERG